MIGIGNQLPIKSIFALKSQVSELKLLSQARLVKLSDFPMVAAAYSLGNLFLSPC